MDDLTWIILSVWRKYVDSDAGRLAELYLFDLCLMYMSCIW